MGVGYNPRIVTDGLVLCLDAANKRSYPGSGTTWIDRSANGYDGTLTNMDASNFSSDNGGSLVFDGSNQYVVTNDSDLLSFTNAKFSLEVYFKYVNKTNQYNTLAGKRDYGATQREYNFFVDEAVSTPTVQFIVSSNLTANWTYVITPAIQKNRWYHAVATSNAGVGRVYLDGQLSAGNASMHSVTTNGNSPFSIGNAYNNGSPMQFLNGSISLTRVYNRALSAKEVLQNYEATKGRYA
jgi:hypothetical protein